MRGSDLVQPFPGIRAPRHSPMTPTRLIAVYNERMSPENSFSHVTAALIHGLPLPLRFSRAMTIHVCSENPATRHGGRGVVGHHNVPGHIRIVVAHGFRVAAPVDTWCQLSTMLSLDELIMVGDALVRRINPLATMEQLRAAVARQSGRRGAKKLRAALEDVRPGVDSPKETELRLLLVRAGLPEPEVNGLIFNSVEAKIATGDLVYRLWRVLVEYDGGQHREDEEQYNWDIDRLDAIMESGWRVVRINKSHVGRRRATAIRRVEIALRDAGWSPIL